jgi:hypothetical protein
VFGFLALAAILAGGIHVAAEGEAAAWDAAKKDFYRDFGNPDIAVKRAALDRIAGLNHVDAAKFLLSIYAQLKLENDGVERKRDAQVEDLEKTLKPLRKSSSSLSAGERDRMTKLEAELKVVIDDAEKKTTANTQLLDVIAASLSKFSDPAAVAELRSRVIKSPDWTDRYAILHGLIASNAPGVGTICLDAAKDKEVRVRMLALDGCFRFKVDAALPLFVAACEDPLWQIRLIGVAAVEHYKSKDGISAIIRQLKKEDGRLRDDISGALKRMTGMDFGYNADIWEKWWTDNKEKWNGQPAGGAAAGGGSSKTGGGGPGGTTAEPPTFFGLKITSKKIVFCLDISGSMNDPSEPPKDKLAPPVVVSGNGPPPEPWEPGMKGTKIEVLKHEFEKTVTKMDPKISFNIIVYSDTHLVWKDKMQLATPAIKAEAIDFVKAQPANGATNMGDALEAAFELAGAGLKDKHYAALVDTIYVMSDGSPNAGKYPAADGSDIIRKVKEWNELSKVIINTVGLGDPTNYNPNFLAKLAGMTGGTFVKR